MFNPLREMPWFLKFYVMKSPEMYFKMIYLHNFYTDNQGSESPKFVQCTVYTVCQENGYLIKNTLLLKNPQFLSNLFVKIRYSRGPYYDKVSQWLGKNCGFFIKGYFWQSIDSLGTQCIYKIKGPTSVLKFIYFKNNMENSFNYKFPQMGRVFTTPVWNRMQEVARIFSTFLPQR